MPFHRVVIKIGDKEYDTGSMISTDSPVGEDWTMIAGMVTEFTDHVRFGWERSDNAFNDD